MSRAATTTDAFNAIAEQKRREIIDLLARGRQSVGKLVEKLRLPQPAVSKHLGVLRKVGLVIALKQGRQRVYSLNAQNLKPVHDWVKNYEQFWTDHLRDIKEVAERKARDRAAQKNQPHNQKGERSC